MSRLLLISLGFHVLLATLWIQNNPPKPGQEGGTESGGEGEHKVQQPLPPVTVKIIPKKKEQKVVVNKKKKKKPPVDLGKGDKGKQDKNKELDCETYYSGIGVYTGLSDQQCTISNAVEGYPAYRGGLRAGDRIISPPCGQIRGPEGTQVHIVYIRNGQVMYVTLTREKICEVK